MENLINKEKLNEKSVVKSVAISVFVILLCLVSLSSATWAWFNIDIASSANNLQAAYSNVAVSVELDGEASEVTDGKFTFQKQKLYTVTITATGTAEKGYCVLSLGEEKYYTPQLSTTSGKNSITFSLKFTAKTEIEFIPGWGALNPEKISFKQGAYYLDLKESSLEEEKAPTRLLPLVENATIVLPSWEIASSSAVSMASAPYAYTDTSRFAGKWITRIGIPVKSVDTSDGTPIFTLSVVKTNVKAYEYVASYKLEIPVEGDSTEINDWIYVDLTELDIHLAEDETLAFGDPEDTVVWGYVPKSISKRYTFRSTESAWSASNNNSIIFDVYAEEVLDFKDVNGEQIASYSVPALSDVKETLAGGAITSSSAVSTGTAPFAYTTNKAIYEGKTITKIGIPVKTVAALDENQTFTLSILRTDSKKYEFVEQYTLKLPLAQLGTSKTVNRWIYVDVKDLNITVGENETLGFGAAGDTVSWGFVGGHTNPNFYFRSSTTNNWTNDYGGIFFDVYVEETISYKDYLEQIRAEEEKAEKEEALRKALHGKSLSILGDSISTYKGYSDNTDYNSTIGKNALYYKGTNSITDVNETWWMQTISKTGMTLCVNNSYSGDKVTEKAVDRALELDNNDDEAPDLIAVYIGINDARNAIDPDTFTASYTKMVEGMKEKYPEADIWLFSLVYTSRVASGVDPEDVIDYNAIIENIAEMNGCGFVDLYNKSGITAENFADYMADGDLHPNYDGMDLITQCFIDALMKKYVK